MKQGVTISDIKITVPAQMRSPIEPGSTTIARKIEQFTDDITRALRKLCDGDRRAEDLFLVVSKRSHVQSYNSSVEIVCNDRLVGLVLLRRTDVGSQEATFFLYREALVKAQKKWKAMHTAKK